MAIYLLLRLTNVDLFMKNYKTYFFIKGISASILLLTSTFSFTSCSKKNFSSLPEYQFKSKDKKPDYSNLHYWAAHPWKKNVADSVPKPLRSTYKPDTSADVFFIHH
ncbi:MAG: hypothetical protein WDM90_18855 [Ferruginibacter sp.]